MEAGVDFVDSRVAESRVGAIGAAEAVGYPVVAKVDPLTVAHKSELGGVKVGLEDGDDVRSAFAEVDSIEPDSSVLLQEMVDGVEFVVEVIDDPDFGPVMVFGPGGVFVELFDDAFSYRALPLTESTAYELIDETVASRLLDGYRGQLAVNRDSVATFLASVSRAYETYDVTTLELNPGRRNPGRRYDRRSACQETPAPPFEGARPRTGRVLV